MIHLEKVCKAFSGHQVLDELDLHVPKGQAFVIMGPSGAGKSVILKHIIGLLKPDSGEIRVDNLSVPDLKGEPLRDLRRDMGYLFQHSALINWLSVYDNIALPLRETSELPEGEIKERVHHVLSLVSLPNADHKFPSEISGGMQKRVGLARALVTKPRIILYDEPEAGLDPGMSVDIARMIRKIGIELGMTSVTVTHSVDCARTVGDHLALFTGGQIALQGTPAEVLDSGHALVHDFLEGSSES